MVSFNVNGTPGPQGSKKAIPLSRGKGAAKVFTGKVSMVESSAKVKPWREDVRAAAAAAIPAPIHGPVNVMITFFLTRPKAHYRTGKFAHLLKPDAPLYPDVKPDIDKLYRSTLDALKSAGVYADDCKVVDLSGGKRYADHRVPGAFIQILPKASTRATGQLAGAVEAVRGIA